MVNIEITRGGCGVEYTDANGTRRYALKTPESGPFACDEEQAARLVGQGVAKYVYTVGATAPEPPHDEEQADTEEPEKLTGHLDPEELEKWDYNALKKLAADMGVKPEGKTKADYIAALVAVEVEPGEEENDGDELPDLTAADPE